MKTDFEVALRDPKASAGIKPVLESGLEEVNGMVAMVEDLLTLSRIDAHQETLANEPFDLAVLARQTARKLRGLASEAGVELRLRDAEAGVLA